MEKAVCERKFADGLFAYYESVVQWVCFVQVGDVKLVL